MQNQDRGALIALAIIVAGILLTQYLGFLPSLAPLPNGQFDPGRDTFAQWLMAFFAGISVLVGIWAAFLVRATLKENTIATKTAIEATRIAQAVGEAQTRAYLVPRGGSFRCTQYGITYNIDVQNLGQSPALNIRTALTAGLPRPKGTVMDYPTITISIPAIAAGGYDASWHYLSNEENPMMTASPPQEFPSIPGDVAALMREGRQTHFEVRFSIGWDDVFGRRQNQTFTLSEVESTFVEKGGAVQRHGTLGNIRTRHYRDNVARERR